MSDFQRSECFVDRAAKPSGIVRHNDWQLKRYDISFDGSAITEADFEKGVTLALKELPGDATSRDRPGVGFLIRHAGRTAHYVILAWWDNQNELITRTIIRDIVAQTPWQDAAGKYSFCIWDLKVLWHERNAFVRDIMTPDAPNLQDYLNNFSTL